MAKSEKVIQEFLPGMEPVKNKKIHGAALHYAKVRDERMEASRVEKDAKLTLLAAMKEEGVTDYAYGDLRVHVDASEDVKVKIQPESAVEKGRKHLSGKNGQE